MIQSHSWVHIYGKSENSNLKRYMHHSAHSSTIYNIRDMETIQVSVNRQLTQDLEIYIHTHTEKQNINQAYKMKYCHLQEHGWI